MQSIVLLGIDEGNGNQTWVLPSTLVLWCDTKKTQFNSNIKGSFEYLTEILQIIKKIILARKRPFAFFNLRPMAFLVFLSQ